VRLGGWRWLARVVSKAGMASWSGGTLVSLDASGATTSFMTWPVVVGFARFELLNRGTAGRR